MNAHELIDLVACMRKGRRVAIDLGNGGRWVLDSDTFTVTVGDWVCWSNIADESIAFPPSMATVHATKDRRRE